MLLCDLELYYSEPHTCIYWRALGGPSR